MDSNQLCWKLLDSSLDMYMPKRIALEGWNYEGLMSKEGMFSPCVA